MLGVCFLCDLMYMSILCWACVGHVFSVLVMCCACVLPPGSESRIVPYSLRMCMFILCCVEHVLSMCWACVGNVRLV